MVSRGTFANVVHSAGNGTRLLLTSDKGTWYDGLTHVGFHPRYNLNLVNPRPTQSIDGQLKPTTMHVDSHVVNQHE